MLNNYWTFQIIWLIISLKGVIRDGMYRAGCAEPDGCRVWRKAHRGLPCDCGAAFAESVGHRTAGVPAAGIEDAEHIDLYDRTDRIPFDKLTAFFTDAFENG